MTKSGFPPNEICATECKGKCCKRLPGICSPDDFSIITVESISELLKSREYAIDCWEESPEESELWFIRPAIKGCEVVFDRTWGGECVFLLEEGCGLGFDRRPMQCRHTRPGEKMEDECEVVPPLHKLEFARTWKPYQNILKEALELVEK